MKWTRILIKKERKVPQKLEKMVRNECGMVFGYTKCDDITFLYHKLNNIFACLWQFDYAVRVYKIPVQQIRIQSPPYLFIYLWSG